MAIDEAEKLYEGTDVLVFWYTWEQCPQAVQRIVLDHIAARTWTAAGLPSPMVMIHSAERQVRQDVCRAWRELFESIYDFEIVVPFGERSIVVWFNQMPAPLAEV